MIVSMQSSISQIFARRRRRRRRCRRRCRRRRRRHCRRRHRLVVLTILMAG